MFDNNNNQSDGFNTQFEQQNVGDASSVSGVDNVTKKKKGKKAAIICGISAAVVAGGCAAAYGLSDFVKNQVKLRISSPEKYYAWVYENNADDIAKSVGEAYRKSLDRYEAGSNSSVTVKYELSQNAKDMFLEEVLGEDYKNSEYEEDKILIDLIDNMNEIKLGANVKQNKNAVEGEVFGSLNGETLLSFSIIEDLTSMDLFGRCAALSEQWLGYSFEEELGDETEQISEFLRDPGKFISPDELEDEIRKYVAVYYDVVEDVELEKKESVSICDIEVNYTVASVEFTEETADELALAFLHEIKKDDIIRNLYVDSFGLMSGEDFDDEIGSAIETIENRLNDDSYEFGNEKIVFNTYIDASGKIRGIGMDVAEEESFICVCGNDGDQIRGELTFASDGTEDLSIKLSAEKNGNKYDGQVDFNVVDTSYDYYADEEVTENYGFSIVFDDLEIIDEEMGYVDGNVSIDVPDKVTVDLKLSSDGDSQRISYDLNILGASYGTITLEYSSGEGASIEIPDKGSAFMIEDPYEFDLEAYVSMDDFESFLKDIFEKIGLGSDLAAEAAKELTEEFYFEFDDDWDYGYDDYDWDDDDWDWDDDDWGSLTWEDDDFDEEEYNEMVDASEKVYKAAITALADLDAEGMSDDGTYCITSDKSRNIGVPFEVEAFYEKIGVYYPEVGEIEYFISVEFDECTMAAVAGKWNSGDMYYADDYDADKLTGYTLEELYDMLSDFFKSYNEDSQSSQSAA